MTIQNKTLRTKLGILNRMNGGKQNKKYNAFENKNFLIKNCILHNQLKQIRKNRNEFFYKNFKRKEHFSSWGSLILKNSNYPALTNANFLVENLSSTGWVMTVLEVIFKKLGL